MWPFIILIKYKQPTKMSQIQHKSHKKKAAASSASASASASDASADNDNQVHLLSNVNAPLLQFRLSNVNVSIANSIRRIILSDIPMVVFKVAPDEDSRCIITANTSGLNNEIVKHRLSCIPIHITDVTSFPIDDYIVEVDEENNTTDMIYVTTEHFKIKHIATGTELSRKETAEIFPPDNLTGDYIDFVRLKARVSEQMPAKRIQLTCRLSMGTSKEDAAYNATCVCSYGNTLDIDMQKVALAGLTTAWEAENKTEEEIKFNTDNWKVLDGKRIFIPNSFDFQIQTVGVHKNADLVVNACDIMLAKLYDMDDLIAQHKLVVKPALNTMNNSYDIVLENEDYTLGKVIEYYLHRLYYEPHVMSFCGFKMLHPHDTFSIIRIAYTADVLAELRTTTERKATDGDVSTEIAIIYNHLQVCLTAAIELYTVLRKEFESVLNP